MKLIDVAQVKIGLPLAHFWLIRRGSLEQVGKPVRLYNPEHIGINVFDLDCVLPDFLYYSFMNLHNLGAWKPYAHGSLALVNIRVSDVNKIEFSGGGGH